MTRKPSPAASPPSGDPQAQVPLSRVAVGRRVVVCRIDGAGRAELEREGILPGSTVVVAARTPLGGPVVVELGRARLALSADVARDVLTLPAGTDGSVA